jgi:hypothetical protein
MSAEQEEQAAFDQLLKLTFIRRERKYYKYELQHEEVVIKRLLEPKPEIKYQRKRQISFPYIEFTPAQQILDELRIKRSFKIKKIIIAIILISIALLLFAKFYL